MTHCSHGHGLRSAYVTVAVRNSLETGGPPGRDPSPRVHLLALGDDLRPGDRVMIRDNRLMRLR